MYRRNRIEKQYIYRNQKLSWNIVQDRTFCRMASQYNFDSVKCARKPWAIARSFIVLLWISLQNQAGLKGTCETICSGCCVFESVLPVQKDVAIAGAHCGSWSNIGWHYGNAHASITTAACPDVTVRFVSS